MKIEVLSHYDPVTKRGSVNFHPPLDAQQRAVLQAGVFGTLKAKQHDDFTEYALPDSPHIEYVKSIEGMCRFVLTMAAYELEANVACTTLVPVES